MSKGTDCWLWVRLKGGYENGFQFLTEEDAARIHAQIQGAEWAAFHVFETPNHRVAINSAALQFCHYLDEPPLPDEEYRSDIQRSTGMADQFCCWLVDGGKPLIFSIDPEDPNINRDAEPQLNLLFHQLEQSSEGFVSFTDMDGDQAFIRKSQIAICTVLIDSVDGTAYRQDA